MNVLRKALERVPDSVRRPLGLRDLRRSVASDRAIARHNGRLAADAPVLNFFPERPLPRAQLVHMLALLGVRIGSDLRSGAQIAWQRDTWLKAADQERLPAYAINRACTDVSKSRVNEAWASVAGYTIAVDPLVYSGPMVVKSELNARHDWRPVNGPLRRRQPGMVYERFIDATDGAVFVQSRPIIMRRHIPQVYRVHFPRQHWRAEAETFSSQANEFYSAAEVEQILDFTVALGLEYGELDVLRDNATGQLYVIDANPTPVGPHHMAADDQAAMLHGMADAFADIFAADLAR